MVGTSIKLAVFPMHSWLPNAYTYAPAIVTVFLAATATNVRFDRAARGFETALDAIVDTAPLQVRIRRLGAELQRTTRRINTLEQRVITQLQQEIAGIELRLQERDREEQFRLKRFKRRVGRGLHGAG